MESLTSIRSKIISDIKILFPTLKLTMHKGQSGKIGVLGGSKDYTGAPYYAATTSLRAGGDLVSVFAPKEAEQPLKCYSPELIVHPYDFCRINSENDEVRNKEIEEITKWFSGLNSLVIGCGYGRENIPEILFSVIKFCQTNNIPIVGDADFLWYMKEYDSVYNLYNDTSEANSISKMTIITPNKVEFQRFWKRMFEEDYLPTYDEFKIYYNLSDDIGELHYSFENQGPLTDEEQLARDVMSVSQKLNGTVVLRKGLIDIITDGNKAFYVKSNGSLKRCGGQGDILAGTLGTFSYYAQLLQKQKDFTFSSILPEDNCLLIAAIAGSVFTRMAAYEAFKLKERSLVTPDIIHEFNISKYISRL